VTDGEGEVVLAASGGRAIRFGGGEVPLMGRATQGVRGIKVNGAERVVGMAAVRDEAELCLVTARGHAKRFPAAELPRQKRDGKGVVVSPLSRDAGEPVALLALPGTDLAAVLAGGRMLRLRAAEIPSLAREARPERVLELAEEERIAAVTPLGARDAGTPSPEAAELVEPPAEASAAEDDGDAPIVEARIDRPAPPPPPPAADDGEQGARGGETDDDGELDLFG
jgi:DNA gyrase subunit A